MNKAEFVQALADDLGTDRHSAAKTLEAFTHLIYAHTVKGEKVTDPFSARSRSGTVRRAPHATRRPGSR